MTLVETEHRLALERLRNAGGQSVSLDELRAAGLDFPAAVVSELELKGYAIERVREPGQLLGVRLLEPEPAESGARRRRHSWPRRRR